jgi:hypothetical protein
VDGELPHRGSPFDRPPPVDAGVPDGEIQQLECRLRWRDRLGAEFASDSSRTSLIYHRLNDKVRTNALVPLPTGYDAVVSKEVAGDLSKPAQIEARSPSIGKNKAVTRAATALFMATSPHGSTNKGMEVARLRLACAIPGEQPSQFSEALRRLGEKELLVLADCLPQSGGR